MSRNYLNHNVGARATQKGEAIFGSPSAMFEVIFSQHTINYLDEKIINHLLDSLTLESPKNNFIELSKAKFSDFSFFTAPAYKALEGYLFQIAKDLNLPSAGSPQKAGGYYYDEEKIDKHMDKLLEELESKAKSAMKLSKEHKEDMKSRIREMKGFLKHYRHTPAHFYGRGIDTAEKAHRSIQTIYDMIDTTTEILLSTGLVKIKEAKDKEHIPI